MIEQFDIDYGRMNAVLGTGLGNGGASTGTATPYSYDDTPTDIILDSSNATQIGALNDGTQIWRVDHQGVDTHAIHLHLFNVPGDQSRGDRWHGSCRPTPTSWAGRRPYA